MVLLRRRKPLLADYRIYEALRRDGICADMSWFEAVNADWNYAVTYRLCKRWVGHWWKAPDPVFAGFGEDCRECRICGITECKGSA